MLFPDAGTALEKLLVIINASKTDPTKLPEYTAVQFFNNPLSFILFYKTGRPP